MCREVWQVVADTMSSSCHHYLISRMGEFGDRPALATAGAEWSYGELVGRVEEAESFLRKREESVLLVGSDYGLDTIALLLAGIHSRKILAPVTSAREEDLVSCARACGAQVWVGEGFGRDAEAVRAVGDVEEVGRPPLAEDLLRRGRSGLVLFSSGITGKPKAMLHDLENFVDAYRDRKARSVSVLLFLLFDHIGGLNTLFGSLASGMTLVLPEGRDPEMVARLIESRRVRILPATPTFLNLMLLSRVQDRFDLSSLRIITYGAEAMPPALLERVKQAFPRARLIQTFGTSETGIARTVPRNDTGLHLEDPGLESKVVDGELWLRSRTQVVGYLNESNEQFTGDGWFRTGDAVAVESDGSLRFLGRKVEIINVGGEKVYPGEVEATLLRLPEVGACRVFGVPNPILGQVVSVEVVASEAGMPPQELRSRIRRFARLNLSRFKIPVDIRVVSEICMGARGKRALRSDGAE